MNTLSLILNGKTHAYLSSIPNEKELITITHLPTPGRHSISCSYSEYSARSASSPTTNKKLSLLRSLSEMLFSTSTSSQTTPISLRSHPRRVSKGGSPGWYSKEGELTLEDFAKKLQTRSKKFEVYMGKCAQSLVMALISPTPLVLLLFNPISLILWAVLGFWMWFGGTKG